MAEKTIRVLLGEATDAERKYVRCYLVTGLKLWGTKSENYHKFKKALEAFDGGRYSDEAISLVLAQSIIEEIFKAASKKATKKIYKKS